MYENENKSLNENTNPEGNMSETTVNWTTPKPEDSRSQRNNGYGPSYGNSRQPGYDPIYPQQTVNGGDHHGNGSSNPHRGPKKGTWVKRVVGITAVAVLFGAVSGGMMTGASHLRARVTGFYGITMVQVQTQAQIPQVAPAVTTQNSDNAAAAAAVIDVSGVAENVTPSIVTINDTMTAQQRDFFGVSQIYQAQSSGSGIIANQTDTEFLIATNDHVVNGAQDFRVTFMDNNDVSAAVRGMDSASGLAIIAVQLQDIPSDTMDKIKVASLGSSGNIKVDRQVVAIGNASGYGQSVTAGCVSALDREITDSSGITKTFIQTDVAISLGNNGGALIGLNGNMIGINATKTAPTEVEGMGFAIPISKAQEILNNPMIKKTRVAVTENAQGYLGIQGTNIDASVAQEFGMPVGTYVHKIVEGGAAASSELKEKDIIAKFDGRPVTSMKELKQMLIYYENGLTTTFTIQSLANGAYVEHDVQITPGTKPAVDS